VRLSDNTKLRCCRWLHTDRTVSCSADGISSHIHSSPVVMYSVVLSMRVIGSVLQVKTQFTSVFSCTLVVLFIVVIHSGPKREPLLATAWLWRAWDHSIMLISHTHYSGCCVVFVYWHNAYVICTSLHTHIIFIVSSEHICFWFLIVFITALLFGSMH